MDNRRDILKSEITEFQQRLGIKVVTTRNLKSIEECRKAFVQIAKHYASIPNADGRDTEIDILRNKVKVLQEELTKYKNSNLKYFEDLANLQAINKNLEEDIENLTIKNNTLYSVINTLNNKKWWQIWK